MRRKGWRFLVTLTLALLFMGVFIGAVSAGAVPRMSQEGLKAKLGDPDLVIIDVRTGGDWKASDLKIKGAIREEAGKIGEWAPKLDPKKTIVLYCA